MCGNLNAIIVLQYMVVYQCVLATANVAAFCVDGSSTSNLQVNVSRVNVLQQTCLHTHVHCYLV